MGLLIRCSEKKERWSMRELDNVTIWCCCWSSEPGHLQRLCQVMQYCEILFPKCPRIFFSSDSSIKPSAMRIDMAKLSGMGDWNYFVNYMVPNHIRTDFAMSVHDDGFPICPELWEDRFLEYDYIGAPWPDGVVGNGGFNIESKKLLELKLKISAAGAKRVASDEWICRKHRRWLERQGIRFAPANVALRFSTELVGRDLYSFGFHGQEGVSTKLHCAWEMLREVLHESNCTVPANT